MNATSPFFVVVCILFLVINTVTSMENENNDEEETPEGYYAFIESPNADPPKVRPPPYTEGKFNCKDDDVKAPHASHNNLCGDLNKGTIPKNPMGQNVLGSSYPFVLIKNMTLKYLSRTLPILKADETLPKVTQLQDDLIAQNTISSSERFKRDATKQMNATTTIGNATTTTGNATTTIGNATIDNNNNTYTQTRQSRKFCDQGGVFCMLYKAINGGEQTKQTSQQQLQAERREDVPQQQSNNGPLPKYEGPPTPCPAKVEYATPVFAKNYQGLWRYVVQIPYEGYFTQTVEVTRCLQSRCHYLDGGCLSSPRWSSLLVAEIYYPDTVLSNQDAANNPQRSPITVTQPPSVQDFQNYQQYLHKRAGLQAVASKSETTTTKQTNNQQHCDGVDSLGCFQVRLYYDWFLIPGSCKCWRPDYFNKYVRRKSNNNSEL